MTTRHRLAALAALVMGAVVMRLAHAQEKPAGQILYDQRCATCHTGQPESRAPALDALRARAPEAIIEALVNGAMRVQGARLSGPERHAIAEYVSGRAMGGDPTGAAHGRCASADQFDASGVGLSSVAQGFSPASAALAEWSGWSPTVTNTRMQTGALTAADVPRLALKWAFGFPDASSAWSQPTIARGRVFVGSQNGTVYSLSAATGCIYWYFTANGGVRTAVTLGPKADGRTLAYFGDTSATVYAVNAASGAKAWTRKVDDHPLARITGSLTLYNGRVYVPLSSYEEGQGANPQYGCCTFRGSLVALDAQTGDVVWKTYVIPDKPKERGTSSAGVALWGPSGSAIWSAPTIDTKRKLVYAATGNVYSGPPQPSSDAVVAFDLDTGAIKWMKQLTENDVFLSGCFGAAAAANPNCTSPNGPDYDFGNSPILATRSNGKDAIVIGQKSGIGYALDPDNQGAVVWQYRAGQGGALGGIEWGSAVDGANAYFPVSDILGPKPGGLHAVNLLTGERVWFTPPPPPACGTGRGCNGAQSAAITLIPGVIFSGSVDGALRAFSTKDGSIVWTFDTNREFDTVNGVPAHGASMLGPGPAVVARMLVVNSGFGAFGGRPGNVLLAFEVK